ncbi:hypothetical protein BaRGS_00019141 [Batillaria attramentaria]|uniref:Uncharacterized protein n=1 Tax=Batillaria attramentaria TaxID=370345 RepID=A0ABD0KR28_9CAEN
MIVQEHFTGDWRHGVVRRDVPTDGKRAVEKVVIRDRHRSTTWTGPARRDATQVEPRVFREGENPGKANEQGDNTDWCPTFNLGTATGAPCWTYHTCTWTQPPPNNKRPTAGPQWGQHGNIIGPTKAQLEQGGCAL